jgi:hypothetical protein
MVRNDMGNIHSLRLESAGNPHPSRLRRATFPPGKVAPRQNLVAWRVGRCGHRPLHGPKFGTHLLLKPESVGAIINRPAARYCNNGKPMRKRTYGPHPSPSVTPSPRGRRLLASAAPKASPSGRSWPLSGLMRDAAQCRDNIAPMRIRNLVTGMTSHAPTSKSEISTAQKPSPLGEEGPGRGGRGRGTRPQFREVFPAKAYKLNTFPGAAPAGAFRRPTARRAALRPEVEGGAAGDGRGPRALQPKKRLDNPPPILYNILNWFTI